MLEDEGVDAQIDSSQYSTDFLFKKKKKQNSGVHPQVSTLIQPSFQKKNKKTKNSGAHPRISSLIQPSFQNSPKNKSKKGRI